MRCKICHNDLEFNNVIPIKNGHICQSCYTKLPESVKSRIGIFTARQLKALMDIITDGNIRVFLRAGRFGIGIDSLRINTWGIAIRDIRRVDLNFHPTRAGSNKNICYGVITLVVETKSPHFLIEEPFFDQEIVAKYSINGKYINYIYSGDMVGIVQDIQKNIESGNYNLSSMLGKWIKISQSRKSKKTKQQNKSEEKKSSEKNSKENNKSQRSNENTGALTPFEKAKKMYGVRIPYTKKELISRRNDLLRLYHPDKNRDNQEEATAMTKLILEYYNMLLLFANAK